jgi:hypothetical protein
MYAIGLASARAHMAAPRGEPRRRLPVISLLGNGDGDGAGSQMGGARPYLDCADDVAKFCVAFMTAPSYDGVESAGGRKAVRLPRFVPQPWE